jgi:hypothetical protein
MAHIHGIPIPSLEQIIVAIELLFILLPFKMLQMWLISEARRNRNHIIHLHVKSGHKSRFRRCIEGECATIGAQVQPQLPVPFPEIGVDLELPD